MENLIKMENLKINPQKNKERLNLDYYGLISIFKNLYDKPQKELEKILNLADKKIPPYTSKEAIKMGVDLKEDKYFCKDVGLNYRFVSEEEDKKISITIKAAIASYLLSLSKENIKPN